MSGYMWLGTNRNSQKFLGKARFLHFCIFRLDGLGHLIESSPTQFTLFSFPWKFHQHSSGITKPSNLCSTQSVPRSWFIKTYVQPFNLGLHAKGANFCIGLKFAQHRQYGAWGSLVFSAKSQDASSAGTYWCNLPRQGPRLTFQKQVGWGTWQYLPSL